MKTEVIRVISVYRDFLATLYFDNNLPLQTIFESLRQELDHLEKNMQDLILLQEEKVDNIILFVVWRLRSWLTCVIPFKNDTDKLQAFQHFLASMNDLIHFKTFVVNEYLVEEILKEIKPDDKTLSAFKQKLSDIWEDKGLNIKQLEEEAILKKEQKVLNPLFDTLRSFLEKEADAIFLTHYFIADQKLEKRLVNFDQLAMLPGDERQLLYKDLVKRHLAGKNIMGAFLVAEKALAADEFKQGEINQLKNALNQIHEDVATRKISFKEGMKQLAELEEKLIHLC